MGKTDKNLYFHLHCTVNIQPFPQLSPWWSSWLRHFVAYSLATSRKKASTIFYDTAKKKALRSNGEGRAGLDEGKFQARTPEAKGGSCAKQGRSSRMLQTGKPACSHARIPPPSWYALPGALLSKRSALFRVLFPERQKKTTGLPEKRLSSPSPRSSASRGTSGQPGIARLRNSFSVRTSTKKAPPLRKSVMASCGDNVSNIGKTIR